MRPEAEVRDRLRALLVQELDRRVEEATKRLPHLCVYNYRHPLDDRKTVDGEPNYQYNRVTAGAWEPVTRTMGLCMYGSESPEDWGGTICEDAVDAQRCSLFQPIRTKAEILTELEQQLKTPGWAEENLPEVAGLLWVLGEAGAPTLPWWKRIWYHWILRVRVEAPLKVVSTINLLPGGRDEGVGP